MMRNAVNLRTIVFFIGGISHRLWKIKPIAESSLSLHSNITEGPFKSAAYDVDTFSSCCRISLIFYKSEHVEITAKHGAHICDT